MSSLLFYSEEPMAEPDQSLNEHEIEGQPENLQPEQAQEHQDDSVAGGGERWPGWPGESVFRILVPAQKVGSIIGRKGEYIKKMCEETKSRIKILDSPPGTTERAVCIFFSAWLIIFLLDNCGQIGMCSLCLHISVSCLVMPSYEI